MKDIHEVLRTHWGYGTFRPMQQEVVRSVLTGRDTLALLPTGGGKSLCFQVPALAQEKLCLVVSPLIALMRDQVGRLRKQGISARAIISGMTQAEIENALDSAVAGKLSFLYVSPERLGSDHFLGRLPRMPLGLIAVDEAHCISQWGYDFRPAYLKIAEVREHVPKVPVIALTASATELVARDIMTRLGFREPHILRGGFERPELVLWVSQGEDKHGRLLRILRNIEGTALVYLRERKGTLRTARFLQHHGFGAEAYHAGMSGADRDRIQKDWTSGATRIVVATNAFGMGIDKADVRSVIHMDLPPDLESYYQEAGRGGRDGKTAHAFLLVAPGDEERLHERVDLSFPPLADVRRVYQAFADMNGIAIGSGTMETYPLDLHAIAERLALPPSTVAHSLKAIELDGKIAVSEGVRSPSRLLFISSPATIYQMRVADQRHGELLEALLRLYGGLFEEPAIVDELKIARLLQWSSETVITRLHELDKLRVLSYRRRSDHPTVTLLSPREDAATMRLDPLALKDRRERAIARLQAMTGYINNNTRCRSALLLSYFDEPVMKDCGRCDICSTRHVRYGQIAGGSNIHDTLGEYGAAAEEMRWTKDELGHSRRKDGEA